MPKIKILRLLTLSNKFDNIVFLYNKKENIIYTTVHNTATEKDILDKYFIQNKTLINVNAIKEIFFFNSIILYF